MRRNGRDPCRCSFRSRRPPSCPPGLRNWKSRLGKWRCRHPRSRAAFARSCWRDTDDCRPHSARRSRTCWSRNRRPPEEPTVGCSCRNPVGTSTCRRRFRRPEPACLRRRRPARRRRNDPRRWPSRSRSPWPRRCRSLRSPRHTSLARIVRPRRTPPRHSGCCTARSSSRRTP